MSALIHARVTRYALGALLALASLSGAIGPAVQPVAAAAPLNPKVVIVVGPMHEMTDRMREQGEEAAQVAANFTNNVVKVFSPNATWEKVKAAAAGASILIYLGHGNGFPSPYRTAPWPYSQNGMGLNTSTGHGDANVNYYGEHYMSQLKLAPNAVVLLHHLCYAAGSSEPGKPDPTLKVAKQRVDNFAAGFSRAGAQAVIAEGHMGPSHYVEGLFTTRQSVLDLWKTSPSGHDNLIAFASTRTPGRQALMDPDHADPAGGFYRSIVVNESVTTVAVTGARFGSTDVDPSTFVVPGAAEVDSDAATLFRNSNLTGAVDELGWGTRVRLLRRFGTAAAPTHFKVQTLEDGRVGYLAADALTPRDSERPRTNRIEASDQVTLGDDRFIAWGRFSEDVHWTLRVTRDGVVMDDDEGWGKELWASWDADDEGRPAPTGEYAWTLQATDGWGNVSKTVSGTFRITR